MISFVNDSGVIEVTDTSVSPPIIERWLKDMLRIEQYVDIIRFTGTLEDAPGRKEYQLADESTAIAERQTLYEYLEDYGGGGGGGGVQSVTGILVDNTDPDNPIVNGIDIYDEDGIVKSNVKNINVIYPLIATDAGANTAVLQVDTNSVLNSVMLEVARFNGLATDQRAMVYVESVNKLYVRQGANLRIYDCDTYELLATIAGALIAVDYILSAGEVWAQGTTTNTQRIDINTNTLIANIAGTIATKSKFIEYTNIALTNTSAYGFVQTNITGITKINTTSFAVSTLNWTVATAKVWAALCLNPVSAMHRHIVATSGASLHIWDPETDTEVATGVNPSGIFSGTGIRGIEYSVSLDCFIVADSVNNIVAYLQPATTSTFTVVRIIRTMQAPSFIVIDEANGLLLVSHGTLPTVNQPTYVSKFRLSDGKPLGIVPTGSIINSAGTSAYMAKKGSENTVFVSGNNTSVITPISEVKYL